MLPGMTLLHRVRSAFHSDLFVRLEGPLLASVQLQQRAFLRTVRELVEAGKPLPPLEETEVRVFSQNGEDGIIAFLVTVVGVRHRRFLEIGIGSGMECNSASLAKISYWTQTGP